MHGPNSERRPTHPLRPTTCRRPPRLVYTAVSTKGERTGCPVRASRPWTTVSSVPLASSTLRTKRPAAALSWKACPGSLTTRWLENLVAEVESSRTTCWRASMRSWNLFLVIEIGYGGWGPRCVQPSRVAIWNRVWVGDQVHGGVQERRHQNQETGPQGPACPTLRPTPRA